MEDVAAITRHLSNELANLSEETAEHIELEKRSEFQCQYGLAILNSGIDLIEELGKIADLCSAEEMPELEKNLLELRTWAEALERKHQLRRPSEQNVEAELMWLAEQGVEKDLDLLHGIKRDLLYSSERIKKLFEIAEQRISKRAIAQESWINEKMMESDLTEEQSKPELRNLIRYLLGYRTLPLLRITPGLGGTSKRGIRDFMRFLLGDRGYIRVDENEQKQQ